MGMGRDLKKGERRFFSSIGYIAVMPDDYESIAICQRLEERGFSLLADCLDSAVVTPQRRVLTFDEIKAYTGKNKFNPRSKISKLMFSAFSYLLHSGKYY